MSGCLYPSFTRFQVHASGKVLEFVTFVPWKEHFFDLEAERDLLDAEITYAISRTDENDWRVIAIPKDSPQSFENRSLFAFADPPGDSRRA